MESPLTSIHSSARVGAGTTVGPFSVVGENVEIGQNCTLGSGVVIHPGSRLGSGVRVDDHCVIGKPPLRSRRSAITGQGPLAPAEIGDDCLIGTAAVLYAGSRVGRGVLVADFATVREEVEIGDETIIGRNVTIENRTTVGARCKIETNAYVSALSRVGDSCFIAPEVTFTNDDYLGRSEERFRHHGGPILETGARVGANATILPGRRIGRDGLVAAGSVVTRDVPEKTVVMGVPATPRGPVPPEELLENQ
ncbi:MAG: DapH/DapD/GlmU-related protein [Candidatus Binatia bacterium]